jgi:hypothetical protein
MTELGRCEDEAREIETLLRGGHNDREDCYSLLIIAAWSVGC